MILFLSSRDGDAAESSTLGDLLAANIKQN